MQISGIYTIRDTPQLHYWDIVFEWEDQISKTLRIPLIPVGKQYDQIYRPSLLRKLFNRLNVYQWFDNLFFTPTNYYLTFHIGPPGVYSFYTRNNVIPIILDFWKNENIRRLESVFRLCPAVFVTSQEVYLYLQEKKVTLNLKHISLSLPDKYVTFDNSGLRDIDIIQIGRSNSTFDQYMKQFLTEFPKIHYVFAKRIGNEMAIVSNKGGEAVVAKKREDFIKLLKRSKISLVSAPGLDNDKTRTGGFSPVTPRFFESAACGCKLLGIYPQNADFEFYGIKEVCPSVTSYDQFRILAANYLGDPAVPDFSSFLKNHITSKRANELLNKLQGPNA